MNILVIGGMHGNEMLGIDLVESLQKSPIKGVEVRVANPKAVKLGKRYVESDLNRSFGDQPDDTYERRLAKTLLNDIEDYDIVLDFHNTQTPNNNCCFVGVNGATKLYGVAEYLGFTECVQATYECINKYASNVLSLEISIQDTWDSVEYWRSKLTSLVNEQKVVLRYALRVYRYSRRVTWDERSTYNIDGWTPFVAIEKGISVALGVSEGSVPIFIGSYLTPYYATLLEPVTRLTLQITDKDDRIMANELT